MKVETRIFAKDQPGERRQLIIIAESEADSKTLDWAFSSTVPTYIQGKRDLADGFGEDYIRLEKLEG